jgi:hypothetical protein
VFRIEFEGDEASVRRQRAGHPDRAVAAERADLEDAARPWIRASRCRNLPCAADTLIAGRSAARLASCAASSAESAGTISPVM